MDNTSVAGNKVGSIGNNVSVDGNKIAVAVNKVDPTGTRLAAPGTRLLPQRPMLSHWERGHHTENTPTASAIQHLFITDICYNGSVREASLRQSHLHSSVPPTAPSRHVGRHPAEDPAHRIPSCRDPRGWTMPGDRPHACLSRLESYLKDMGMAGLAPVWAMARRRTKEYRRKVDAATRCSGVCPIPDLCKISMKHCIEHPTPYCSDKNEKYTGQADSRLVWMNGDWLDNISSSLTEIITPTSLTLTA